MNRYILLKEVGEGTFGHVFHCRRKSDNEEVAIKLHKNPYKTWDEVKALRELWVIKNLPCHPSIAQIDEVILDSEAQTLYFVMEYLPDGNLDEYLEAHLSSANKFVKESTIQSFMYQILTGIYHCHSHGYYHRDLKPENLLLRRSPTSSGGFDIKIADFSLARRAPSGRRNKHNMLLSPATSYTSARWYRAPEILLGDKQYSYPVDLFALGCIFAELYQLFPLFPGSSSSEVDQLFLIWQFLGAPTPSSWPEGIALANARGIQVSKVSPRGVIHDIEEARTNNATTTGSSIQDASSKASRTDVCTTSSTKWDKSDDDKSKVKRIAGMMRNEPVSEWAFDLFRKLIEQNPKKRATAKEGLEHKYFLLDSTTVQATTKQINKTTPRSRQTHSLQATSTLRRISPSVSLFQGGMPRQQEDDMLDAAFF